jgi:hypothetical protein
MEKGGPQFFQYSEGESVGGQESSSEKTRRHFFEVSLKEFASQAKKELVKPGKSSEDITSIDVLAVGGLLGSQYVFHTEMRAQEEVRWINDYFRDIEKRDIVTFFKDDSNGNYRLRRKVNEVGELKDNNKKSGEQIDIDFPDQAA